MAPIDGRGLPITTSSGEAAALYREGVDLLLSAWPGAVETLRRAVEADPGFALAHAALARAHAVRAEPQDARRHIAQAVELAQVNGTERERSHVEALSLAIGGQGARALDRVLTHLDTWPRDVVIFGLPLGAFGLFAFSGMAGHDQARVDLCERHAAQFSDEDWWFLTYRGWSQAENGAVALGRDLAERGFALRPANANGAHAVSHAMFEEGSGAAAEAFIEDWLPSYDRSGVLHGHIAWHQALAALERGDAARALSIYDGYVQPAASTGLPINIVTDTVSFLWRMAAYGHGVPAELWRQAADYAEEKFPTPGQAFIDVHLGLAQAATGRTGLLQQRIDDTTRLVEAGTLAAGPVVPGMCRAALAFAEERYATCVAILEPLASEVLRIGGSGAQREVFHDTLLVALMRSGETEKARRLLDQRLHRRPSPRDSAWMRSLAA
ncbi:tetratricopeptide repeat protein [Phreatobacter cathodiphilus]|uniref:Tetratricopeptide repeat protein 38 n=1 Tax=Phreatobacter cathodiphilus TaxID=1868589 RepID=A0A2S0NB16_9HYPH|nr:tetratricopeptide repeat protein [Phreatobacter cathodiphilus]AVO45121.1 tetratricopeptide repeat protein 38 family protein [Phreatobacter cathodiphilus]